MEGPDVDWKTEEEEAKSDVQWILEKVLSLGKKVVFTGFLISSAPLVLPPIVILSALGFAFSIPLGLVFASYKCTHKLMNKLLPMPTSSPLLEHETMFEHEDEREEQEEKTSGDMEEEEKEQMESLREDKEKRIESVENENKLPQEDDDGDDFKDKGGLMDVNIEGEGEEEEKGPIKEESKDDKPLPKREEEEKGPTKEESKDDEPLPKREEEEKGPIKEESKDDEPLPKREEEEKGLTKEESKDDEPSPELSGEKSSSDDVRPDDQIVIDNGKEKELKKESVDLMENIKDEGNGGDAAKRKKKKKKKN